jgi:hypothetical protein
MRLITLRLPFILGFVRVSPTVNMQISYAFASLDGWLKIHMLFALHNLI